MNDRITLDEAIDILAIQRLLYTNFRATDSKDWDLFEATLADDVEIEFVGLQPSVTVTRRELREQSEPNYANVRTQHMSTNLDVRATGDTATSSYGRALHEYCCDRPLDHPKDNVWHIYARYENGYVRACDGWRISRILMEPRWQEGNPRLLDQAKGCRE